MSWLPKSAIIFLALLLPACEAAPLLSAPASTPAPTQDLRRLPPIDTQVPYTPTFLPYPRPPAPATPEPAADLAEKYPSFQKVFTGDLLLGQHNYSYQAKQNAQIRFLMYLPNSYAAREKWPLILFLHSSLEKGSDLNKLKERALPQKLESEEDFPFIVISPQISEGLWFEYIDSLEDLLDQLESALPVDKMRIYLTGFSLGGYGTWAYARKHPERFAAIAPVAGSLDEGSPDFVIPTNICSLRSVAVWAFHGADDTTVDPDEAVRLVRALTTCGGEARVTLFPQTGHMASGDLAYADPALYDWLLAHQK